MFQIRGKYILFLSLCFILLNPSISFAEKGLDPVEVNIILQRAYLDGEISEELKVERVWSMEDFWLKYEQWDLVDTFENGLVFKKQIDDISPLLKANGYFGITEDGTLTIFNGKPHQTNIIQSFFQLNTERLESRKHLQLKKGIPIKTKDRYVEVLETFKPYNKSVDMLQ